MNTCGKHDRDYLDDQCLLCRAEEKLVANARIIVEQTDDPTRNRLGLEIKKRAEQLRGDL